MGLNSFFKFIFLILANLFIYFIAYYALKMEEKSTIHRVNVNKFGVTLEQDIFVESENPKIINVNTGDSHKDELLRFKMVLTKNTCF